MKNKDTHFVKKEPHTRMTIPPIQTPHETSSHQTAPEKTSSVCKIISFLFASEETPVHGVLVEEVSPIWMLLVQWTEPD